jgi:membrane-bound lytic murein transglycosylase D
MKFSRVFAAICVCVLLTVPQTFAQTVVLPADGLESRIEFWKKVYTLYGENDNIIHDRFHVNLIYDVATDEDVDSRVQLVRDGLSEIASNLDAPETFSPIAQRIFTAIGDNGLTPTPSLMNELAANIHTQRGIKERFRGGIIRSGRYVDQFQTVFEAQGLPKELALLPLVESSFTNARSKVGAAGIWQFMRSTGRLYMKVNSKVDERLDPMKSTRAAAKLLSGNFDALGAWPLAITAYNHGRGGMLRAQSEHGDDMATIIREYDGKTFGYASMNFYTEFLAAVEVYQNYAQYFGELALDRPTSAPPQATVVQAKTITPTAKAAPAVASKYKVRRGDTLWEIAQKFGTSIRDLMEKNDLQKPAIYAGQLLLVK